METKPSAAPFDKIQISELTAEFWVSHVFAD